MCVYIYICIHIYIHEYVSVCMYVHLDVYGYAYNVQDNPSAYLEDLSIL